MDGVAPSGSGRDHTMSSGSVIFARVSRPSRQRNALVVYSADRRDFFLLLKRGYLARLAKKFVNADLQVPQRLLQRHARTPR